MVPKMKFKLQSKLMAFISINSEFVLPMVEGISRRKTITAIKEGKSLSYRVSDS